jgi:hypothetical protein
MNKAAHASRSDTPNVMEEEPADSPPAIVAGALISEVVGSDQLDKNGIQTRPCATTVRRTYGERLTRLSVPGALAGKGRELTGGNLRYGRGDPVAGSLRSRGKVPA